MSFFIKAPSGDLFEMDATVQVRYSQKGRPTEYAVASKRKSSDHYVQEPDTVSFSGYVGAVKFARRRDKDLEVVETLEGFEKGLRDLKRSGEFFTCTFSQNIPPLKNCVFTNLDMIRSTEDGFHCIKVDFTIQQVIVSTQAEVTEAPIPASAYADIVEESEKGDSSTSETTPTEDRNLGTTLREVSPDIADATGF